MKSVVLLISAVHLLLAFSSAATTPNQDLKVVRDIDGNILRSDARYFVVAPFQGAGGGGVTRGAGDDGATSCSSQVVQSPIPFDRGTSVYFKPIAPDQVEIAESISVNIEFYNENQTICNKNVWEVEGFPGFQFLMFLSTNGEAGNPLRVASLFQIKKSFADFYKLAFCPLDFGGFTCTDIGIEVDNGQRRLAVNAKNPFYFGFIKDTNSAIKSII